MKNERSSREHRLSGRHLEMEYEAPDDPYHLRGKLPEPTVCGDCGAVFHDGRWQWMSAPAHAHQTRCAACRRVHEGLPAGYVSIEGKFPHSHRDEVLHLVRNVETREKKEHPMQRLMSMDEVGENLSLTTTDIHLARNIGEALRHAYKGKLNFHYNKSEYLLRVQWQR